MLKDGEKGAVLQRGKKTYAIVPHCSLGLVTPDQLRRMADIADKFNAALKITSAQRIAIVGLQEEQIDQAWAELGMDPGAAVGLCVRSVKACPGITFCRLATRDSLALAKRLDSEFHGRKLPWKFKMAVSGCVNQCAENCIKDFGFFGKRSGWVVTVGGNGGSRPLLAMKLAEKLDDEQAFSLATRVLDYFEAEARKTERMGRMLQRIGFENFKKKVLA